ncbi:hypothetical protein KC366_g17316 [Hortaea werneckii]|nr:hypothetical protein KC366_g17316 [Hortaea werneckii]
MSGYDPGRLLTTPGPKPHPVFVDGIEETPPLPTGWTQHHDRAICVLDAKGYSLPTIVNHLRKTFPRDLRGSILTPAMVNKRLRVLDQDVEIDYWRVGLGLVRGGGGGIWFLDGGVRAFVGFHSLFFFGCGEGTWSGTGTGA